MLEICWHCSVLADLQLSGFPGGPLLIRLSCILYSMGQTTPAQSCLRTVARAYVISVNMFAVGALVNENIQITLKLQKRLLSSTDLMRASRQKPYPYLGIRSGKYFHTKLISCCAQLFYSIV